MYFKRVRSVFSNGKSGWKYIIINNSNRIMKEQLLLIIIIIKSFNSF